MTKFVDTTNWKLYKVWYQGYDELHPNTGRAYADSIDRAIEIVKENCKWQLAQNGQPFIVLKVEER